MDADRRQQMLGLAAHLLTYEGELRAWLRRSVSDPSERDDVIQEAYCRICASVSPEPIFNPRAYFYRTVRNVLIDQRRRTQVVSIDMVSEIEELGVLGDEHSPERITAGRRELDRLRAILSALPARARRIIELRKIEGLSQKAVARELGVSENIVENDATRALRQVIEAYEAEVGRFSAEARPSAKTVRRGRVRGARR